MKYRVLLYQFSEESVSSVEPSLSVSTFRRWCSGLQREQMRGEAREGMFVASPLALELDTERPEIDAILKKEEKKICCYFISVHICHHKSL